MGEHGWAYRRRQPEGTVLYEAVRDHLATLLEEASELGRGLPRSVERDFARYLERGVLAHGFARVRCESCPHRGRWVLLKEKGLLSDVLALFLRAVFVEALPPPMQGEVERLLKGGRHPGAAPAGEKTAQGPEDARQAWQAHSLQQRLRWREVDVRPPPRKQPQCGRTAPRTSCSPGWSF